jgi:segregation and condensation protein B
MELLHIIEALIFAAGDGISPETVYAGLSESYTKKEVDEAIAKLKKTYSGNKGIVIIEFDNKIQMQTNPAYGDIIGDTLKETRERELSKTLLKVLAIVAYKQPITRPEIEELRGANSDYVVAMLLKLNLIEPQGRKESLGNPILYGTTDEFLKKFGLESLADLPDFDDLMLRIKNNYEKHHRGLYHERSFATDESVNEKPENDDDEELPDFLADEDIVEID